MVDPLEQGLNLKVDISEEDGNALALEIIRSEHSNRKESVSNIAFALYNIGQYRLTGAGFSEEASDEISDWIEKYFDESDASSDKLADILYELTSKRSDELVQKLYSKTKNEYLRATLFNALSYKGS